ncbi:MAG: hypothetical protein Q7S87_08930 [Agitococcus sp.]|nr:hypothetical protein [Agitococcus sp.]MDO9177024.1 hypothetical protein [Agitococcus sp.]
MFKSLIDMSKPHTLYASGIGLIMLLSLLTSNISVLAVSNYLDFSYRKPLCAALFLAGAVMGAYSLNRHVVRMAEPWKVPQSQVSWTYLFFFISTVLAVLLAR